MAICIFMINIFTCIWCKLMLMLFPLLIVYLCNGPTKMRQISLGNGLALHKQEDIVWVFHDNFFSCIFGWICTSTTFCYNRNLMVCPCTMCKFLTCEDVIAVPWAVIRFHPLYGWYFIWQLMLQTEIRADRLRLQASASCQWVSGRKP